MFNQYTVNMCPRNLHIVHLLIRQNLPGGEVGFLVFPHEHWKNENGQPILALPAKNGCGSARSFSSGDANLD